MKNLKRLIALVAVFALALTTMASAASFSDVAEDSAYYRAVEQLHKIGIIDGYTDGTFKPEQTVTRAEMAKLIAAMQGYAESAEGHAVTKFSDVPSTHWASGYIASATGTGIDGLPDGTFAPERNVKYEEAVKMIMATLGYTVIANADGGYPMGYISAAIKEKVSEDVTNANIGTEASRGTIAQLIYNAIDTPLVEQITWNKDGSGDYIKYDGESKYGNETVREKTLMTENLGIVKGEGVVYNNTYYGLSHAGTFEKEDDLAVDIAVDWLNTSGPKNFTSSFNGTNILVADTDAADYVGKAVNFYAIKNAYEKWEILSILDHEVFNKTITFAIDAYDKVVGGTLVEIPDDPDTEDVDESDSYYTDVDAIYYYKDNARTSTKITMDPNADVMVNFVSESTANLASILSTLKTRAYSGQVTLIDNDKNLGYDTVIIEAAGAAVVEEVTNGIVYFKDAAALYAGNRTTMDPDADDLVVKFIKDGEEITVDELAEGDVLSIVGDTEGYAVAEVMSNIIDGSIEGRKDSTIKDGAYSYKVDGTWYEVAYGVDALDDAEVGDAGVFYIDKYGKIAYYDETLAVAVGNYAWITGVGYEESTINGKTVEVQMLTKDGVKVYELAAKFIIDEEDFKLSDVAVDDATAPTYINAVEDVETSATTVDLLDMVDTLVSLRLSGNTIKEITTADYDDDILETVDSAASNGVYEKEDNKVEGTDLDLDAVVFFVETVEGKLDKANSYVGTVADLAEGDVLPTYYSYKNKNTDEDASVLVAFNALKTVSAASGLAVIVDLASTSNEDDEDIWAITALFDGAEVELTTTADVYSDNKGLKVADIVQMKVNSNNVVTNIAYIESGAGRGEGEVFTDNIAAVALDSTAENKIYGGYATAIKPASKTLTIDGEDFKLGKFDNIYVIDDTGRKISIEIGVAASYNFDKYLFGGDGEAAGLEAGYELYIDDTLVGDGDTEKVADFVIIRAFDNDNIEALEAVIIKGTSDYTIKD